MAKNTRQTTTHHLFDAWLVCDQWGGMKMTRTQPAAGLGEIAVSVTIQVPKSLFTRPLLRASIELPETPPMDPKEAVRVVADAIEQGCDLAVSVTIAEPR